MSNWTILYLIFGILMLLFLIDAIFIKPKKVARNTDDLLRRMKNPNQTFRSTLPKMTKQRGVVTVADNSCVLECCLMIASLQTQLPVHVYYFPDELSTKNIQFIQKASNARCINIVKTIGIPRETLKASKQVFAMIYNPFKEVLWSSPTVVWLKNPGFLFGDPGYLATGALFWKDCQVPTFDDTRIIKWIKSVIPYKRPDNWILNGELGSFQSDAIVVLDKAKHLSTCEKLWLFCQEPELKNTTVGGTKELFWLCSELSENGYTFIQQPPGIIGTCDFTGSVCGNLLFYDPHDLPMAFNGPIGEFTHTSKTAAGGSAEGRIGKWQKVPGASKTCLAAGQKEAIPPMVSDLLNEYLKIVYSIKTALL